MTGKEAIKQIAERISGIATNITDSLSGTTQLHANRSRAAAAGIPDSADLKVQHTAEPRAEAGAGGPASTESQKPTASGRHSVDSYTGPEFSKWNQALRSGTVDRTLREKIDSLVRTLRDLPEYVGTVHRGTILPPDVLAGYQKGNIITEPAFLSTSTKNGTFTGAVRFHIESKTGKLLSPLSRYPTEAEVLFPPGTQFEVTKRKYNRLTATTWINMVEI